MDKYRWCHRIFLLDKFLNILYIVCIECTTRSNTVDTQMNIQNKKLFKNFVHNEGKREEGKTCFR